MASSRLISPLPPTDDRFWTDPGPRLLLAESVPDLDQALVAALAAGVPPDAVVFASSGSTGNPKLTVLTREALLRSARQVADWLALTPADRQLCVLPLFHVGGLGIVARSRVSGAGLVLDHGRWDPQRFARTCADESISVTSLVPTQVFDLVDLGVRAPRSLRTVVVGGGALDGELESEARHLGWPVLASFGMTETASMVATEKPGLAAPGPGWLPVIDGWEASVHREGTLRLRGPALFSGRLVPSASVPGGWVFVPVDLDDGWFATADLAEVETDARGQCWLRPTGRTDDAVKIRGELVSLSKAQDEIDGLALARGLDPRCCAVIDLPDARTGARLVLAGERQVAQHLEPLVEAFNRRAPAFARIEGRTVVETLPRSPLGKLRRTELKRLAGGT